MIATALVGTLAILLSHAVLTAAFVGLGLSVRRAFGARTVAIRDVPVAFFVGVGLVVAVLYAWTFVFPINSIPLAIVLVAGLGSLLPWRRALATLGRDEPWSRTRWLPAVLILSSLWVANLCRGPLINSDTALYHYQGVLWAKAHPTVPGLVNLFGPLGFNNGSFVYDALLDAGPWSGEAHHIANGLLLQAFLSFAWLGLFRIWRATGSERLQGVFDAVLIAPATNMVVQDWLTSFATDLPETVFLLMAASETFKFLTDRAAPPVERAYRAFCILAFMAIAVTFKVSVALVAVLLAVLVLGRWLLVERPERRLLRQGMAWSVLVPAVIAVVWMGRGVVLSGYPLFPSSALAFPVDWRAPEAHADCEFAFAAFSSRASVDEREVIVGEVGVTGWIGRWFAESATADLHMLAIPAAMVVVAGLVLLVGGLMGRRGDRTPGGSWLAIPALAGLVAWFALAPEPRYGSPLLWILAALAVAGCFRRLGGGESWGSARRYWLALLIVGVSPLVIHPLVSAPPAHRRLPAWKRLVLENVMLPSRPTLLQPTPFQPNVTRYVTRSGLPLHFTSRICASTPIPCTPNPAPNLRLREPGRLDRGFAVDGGWQMQFWPANRPLFTAAIAELDRATGGQGCRAASRNTSLLPRRP
ncbi:MAG TPA: hypothetical protein VFV33_01065 [Gemmatimonadaceae bacterium]|nr:hypothetical protein [Gemmatimonadaceae bacterium]